MKNILAHLGIVALVLLWLHFKQKPSASVSPSPQPAVIPSMTTKTTPVPQTCEGPKRIDPYEIWGWVRYHPNCVFQPALSLLKTNDDYLGRKTNNEINADILPLGLGPVTLQVSSDGATHFFFFSYTDDTYTSWRFLGEVEPQDYIFSYHVVRGELQSWFVVRERWARGSSIGLHGETWYEVTDSSVKQVLAFPVNGRELYTGGLKDRFFDGVAVSQEIINGHTTVKVKFKVNYIFPDDYPEPFFTKSQQAIFIRNNKTGEFRLAKTLSTITEKEFGDVYSIELLDDPKFLKYNFAELTQLASRGSRKQKDALRKYLLGFPKLKQAQSLLAKLH